MGYGLVIQTAPVGEPLTTAEAKKQVEVASAITAHDAYLDSLVTAARQEAERVTGRQILTATWDLFLDRFPSAVNPIWIPLPPLASITSIVYTDDAGVSQTWAASKYVVSVSSEPGRVSLAYGEYYPVTRAVADAVRVRFAAGYGAAAAVPKLLKQAMLLRVADLFAHRASIITGTISSELPKTVQWIYDQFRVGDEFYCYGPASYATA